MAAHYQINEDTLPDLNATFVRWVEDFETETEEARGLSEKCKDFYDGRQWNSAESAALKKRKQPEVVSNYIHKKVNWVLGHEARTRTDPQALPRTPQHADDAAAISDALRYVCERENFDQVAADVCEDLTVMGYAACVVEAEQVPVVKPLESKTNVVPLKGGVAVEKQQAEAVESKTEIRIRPVYWDRFFYDPHSRKADFSDATYMGILNWMHREEFMDRYGQDEDAANEAWESAYESAGTTFSDRPDSWVDKEKRRVRVVEMYWQRGADWYVAHFVRNVFTVKPQPTGVMDDSGARHICPLVPVSAFVERNNARYSPVRQWLSPQEMINKYHSKALHLLNSRQIIYEVGAVEDPFLAQTELAKPDGAVAVTPGLRFDISQTGDLASGQMQLLQGSKQDIDMLGGARTEGNSASESGRLFMAQEQAAAQELEPLFDAFRSWKRRVYRTIWYLIKQHWREERWFRVTDDANKTGFKFVGLNRRMTRAQRLQELVMEHQMSPPQALQAVGMPDVAAQAEQMMAQAQQQGQDPTQLLPQVLPQLMRDPRMAEVLTHADVSALDVDILLDVAPDSPTVQHEQFTELARLAAQGIPIPPDVIIRASQLRNKQELLEKLDNQQAQQAAAQQQQQQMQIQMQMMQLQMQKLQAETQSIAAKAAKDMAEAQSLVPAKAMVEQMKAQVAIPAEADKDKAISMRHAAETGAELAGGPELGDGQPTLAAPGE